MAFSLGEKSSICNLAKKVEKKRIVRNFSVYAGDLSFYWLIFSYRDIRSESIIGIIGIIGINFLRIVTPLRHQINLARVAHYNSTNRLTGTGPGSSLSKTSEDTGFPDCGMAPGRGSIGRVGYICMYNNIYVPTHAYVYTYIV